MGRVVAVHSCFLEHHEGPEQEHKEKAPSSQSSCKGRSQAEWARAQARPNGEVCRVLCHHQSKCAAGAFTNRHKGPAAGQGHQQWRLQSLKTCWAGGSHSQSTNFAAGPSCDSKKTATCLKEFRQSPVWATRTCPQEFSTTASWHPRSGSA